MDLSGWLKEPIQWVVRSDTFQQQEGVCWLTPVICMQQGPQGQCNNRLDWIWKQLHNVHKDFIVDIQEPVVRRFHLLVSASSCVLLVCDLWNTAGITANVGFFPQEAMSQYSKLHYLGHQVTFIWGLCMWIAYWEGTNEWTMIILNITGSLKSKKTLRIHSWISIIKTISVTHNLYK